MQDEVFAEWIETINDVDMEIICDEIGVEVRHVGSKKQCICPFHDDHSFGSCYITDANYMYCFACHSSANNIKLVQQVEGLTFWDACLRICDIAGIDVPQSNANKTYEKRMPFEETKTKRNRQLELLQLSRTVSVFCANSFTDNSVEAKQYNTMTLVDAKGNTYSGASIFDEDGYVLGYYTKNTLQELFVEDEVTFNYMVIGRLFYALTEMISDYIVKDFDEYEDHKQLESDIELLIPLARYYQSVSKGYGYDLDFIDQYQKKPFRFKTNYKEVYA